ncbi:sialate O-acetylesterase [Neptunitalea lumnitzerae]|uniref:Sialate O-acetylesterase domain-containing protein n=1 Tax=Neptunitalea lumnitzerae TaxID=2965509 RepID=A0ABQ5MII4_9FLAO|nr:sialate O-acetylesterase [Neptunitalea sp. Y10]GLB49199.1 hypothetical protein Y10_15670 [Neptunitalea sp. Y10]
MKKLILTLALGLFAFIGSAQKKGNDYLLFYLGGQSNMVGYGYVKELPDSLSKKMKDIYIFDGNSVNDGTETGGGLGIWAPLQPGHGSKFTSDGKKNNYSERFGVELSFAYTLKQKYPDKKIAIIKYARGGTSIDSLASNDWAGCWEPDMKGKKGLNQYDYFLNTMQNAMSVKDIDGDGKEDRLIPAGILWMQGEQDATYDEKVAMGYYGNLKNLMGLLRASMLSNDLPVVIGKISDSWNSDTGKVWTYGELVQYAQEKFARTDGNAAIVRTTRYYKYSDTWHYDTEGYIDFGKQFAFKMLELMK